MPNPITVGTTAIVAVNRNEHRQKVRFQNVGPTTLYFIRQKGHTAVIPTATNFEFELISGGTTEVNEAFMETKSTAQFNVVSSATGGLLAIFETTIGRTR